MTYLKRALYSLDIALRHYTYLLAIVKDVNFVSEGMMGIVVREADEEK